jgi:nicotinamidase-related amidase
MTLFDSLGEKVDPRHTALLVLDMQRGYWPPKDNKPHTGSEILPTLIPFIEAARAAGVGTIYVRNSFSEWVNQDPWIEKWRTIREHGAEGYLIEETESVKEMPPLEPQQGDLVLNKHFWNVFAHSPIDLALRSRGIETCILTGGGVLGAVESAAKDAVVRGYYTVLVTDCIWPVEGPVFDVGVGQLGHRVCTLAKSGDLMGLWQQRG